MCKSNQNTCKNEPIRACTQIQVYREHDIMHCFSDRVYELRLAQLRCLKVKPRACQINHRRQQQLFKEAVFYVGNFSILDISPIDVLHLQQKYRKQNTII